MITHGPEFDKFEVESWMEFIPFELKLFKEIGLNHPYKVLLLCLNKHPPGYSKWDYEDINDYYFSMLDDYNRYGFSFSRERHLYPGNILYVEENDFSKSSMFLRFGKYEFVGRGYDKKELLFNNLKKIDLNKYDKGFYPLSKWEKTKRNFIRNQKNKYLQVALMDPDVYDNDELFEELMAQSDDYYNSWNKKYNLIYIDIYPGDKFFF